jgi:hypothetical protein
MDSGTLSNLAHDIDFRLAMKKAARSDQPLPPKVLRWLTQDDEFQSLVQKAIGSIKFEWRGLHNTLRLVLEEEEAKTKLLASLEKDERVALLLAEKMDRYNHTMKVLSGLRSRLRSLFEDKDKPSASARPADWSWLNYLNPSQPNPLLNLGLAGALGIGTIGGTALGYKFVKEFREVTSTIHDSQMITKEFRDGLSKEVHDQIIREVPIIVQQGLPQRTEIRLVEVPCRNCTNSPGTLTGTLSLQVPAELPEFRVGYATPLTLASTPEKRDKTGEIIVPAGLSFNVNGLPAFPNSLSIPPTYRLDNPPPSTAKLTSETKLQVRYPANSYTATTCPVSFTRNGDELTGTFGECTPDKSVKKPGATFSITIPKDDSWVFVSEADALIRVEHLRNGFLGLGKTDLRISMQAAPYAPMLTQTSQNQNQIKPQPGPQPAASAMKSGGTVGP